MIHHVHPPLCLLPTQPRRPLHRTWKRWINRIKRRLPNLAELVQEPRHGGLVRVVVQEHNDALPAEDHLRQQRPVIQAHGHPRRHVQVRREPARLDGRHKVRDGPQVAVTDEDGHDVERVRLDPARNGGQVGLHGPGIEQVARRVAVVQGAVQHVRLALQHAHAVVELGDDIQRLVAGGGVGPGEHGVVRGDLRDVAVPARAKLWVVVAELGVGWRGGGGGAGSARGERGGGILGERRGAADYTEAGCCGR